MAKRQSAEQRSRRADRRAKRTEPESNPTASAAKGSIEASAPNPHSTEARAARMRAERNAARRKVRLRRGALGFGVGVPLVVVLAFSAGFFEPNIGVEASNEGGVGRHIGSGRVLPQQNRPPSSGPHYGSSAAYAVTTQPIPPGNWLHNLEHGGIVILYRCADSEECGQIASRLRSEVADAARPGASGQVKIVATPYQDMDTPFTVVAWRRTLPLEGFDAEQMLAFYDRYVDRGPEAAP